MREVQARVRTEQSQSGFVVGPCRLGLIGVAAHVDRLAFAPDHHAPFVAYRVPEHALEPRCPACLPPVGQVLSLPAHAEILAPIVPSIAVGMIDDFPRRRVHEEPVHVHLPAPDPGARVTRFASRRPPAVSVEPLEIRRIDERKQSAPQRDLPDVVARHHVACRSRLGPSPEVPAAGARVLDPPRACRDECQPPRMIRMADAEQKPFRPVPGRDGIGTAGAIASQDAALRVLSCEF